jgi:hypothetical protein
MSDVDNPETTPDIVGPSKIKKTEEVHNLDSASVKIPSISTKKGGVGTKVEQKKGEATLLRDEEDPSKKMNFSPLKPS